METNILFTGDWHCGLVSWGVDRSEEIDRSFAQLIRQVKEYRPKYAVITGDMTESFRYPGNKVFKQVSGVIKELLNCSGDLKLLILKGNHDWAGLEIFQDFHNRITYIETPRIIDTYPYPIVAIPYQKSYQLPEGGYGELISSLMDADGREAYILAAHAGAEGDVPNEPTIPTSVLNDSRIKKAFLGHIHTHEKIKGTKNAFYTGTVIRNTFGESQSDTGAWMLNYENTTGKLEVRDISVECAALKTIEFENLSEAISDGRLFDEAEKILHNDTSTMFRIIAPKHSYKEEDIARTAKEIREELGIGIERPVTYPFVAFDAPSAERHIQKIEKRHSLISEGISIKSLWDEWCKEKKSGETAATIGSNLLEGAVASEVWESLKAGKLGLSDATIRMTEVPLVKESEELPPLVLSDTKTVAETPKKTRGRKTKPKPKKQEIDLEEFFREFEPEPMFAEPF